MSYIERLNQKEEFEHWQGASTQEILHIEKKLNVMLPRQYKKFLSECGMCNIGDTNILGVAKDETSLFYPVIDVTTEMREESNLSEEFIVISYEVGEYLTLYKISKTQELEDSAVYGVDIQYNDLGQMICERPQKLFASFKEYFIDFLELGA